MAASSRRSSGEPVHPLGVIGRAADPQSSEVRYLDERCVAICGDNRQILSALPRGSVHCTITSPPYGDQKNYGSPGEIGSGNSDYAGYLDDLRRIVAELFRITVDGGVMWLVLDTLKRDGQSLPLPFQAIELAKDHGWIFHECVIWDKGRSLPWSHPGHFRGVFEYVLLFGKGRIGHFDLDAVRDADHLSSYWVRYPERFNPLGKAPTDLWHIPIPVQGSWSTRDLRHLCPFPEDLVRRMVALTSKPGDVVMDPFAGTGIVPALACAMGRLGVGIELNARYYDTFTESGFARIVASAQRPRTERSPGKLAQLISDLRVLKFPRTLFAQISRADRLGDQARSMIAAMLVNRATQGGGTKQNAIDVTILATAKTHVARLKNACAGVKTIPPLSKFGIEPTIEVVEPRAWKGGAFRAGHAVECWHRYHAGTFNAFDKRLSATEMKWVLQHGFTDRETRVPPIFSGIGVRVLRGIED